MLSDLPNDIYSCVAKEISEYYDILNARLSFHIFKEVLPLFKLKHAKLEYLINNKKLIHACINENCFWDSYIDEYFTNINYRRYIHSHQTALNGVLLSNLIGQPPIKINIPYCFECMCKFSPIQIYP